MKQVRILLVDSHSKLLSQIETRLSDEQDFEVVGKAMRRDEALDSALAYEPNVILIDPVLESSVDLDLIKEFQAKLPSTDIVVLTAIADTALQIELRKNGITRILEKGIDSGQLIEVLREVVWAREK